MGRIACLVKSPIVIGVDTHKDVHVAVALDLLGARLGECSAPAKTSGYVEVEEWAAALGDPVAFGVEGTSSYGAGLAQHLGRRGHKVIEVNRVDRSARRNNAKSDPIDAEAAARSVLSGVSTATAKSRDGAVEIIRLIKIARDSAVKSRSQAMITLKATLVTVPAELREPLEGLTDTKLIQRCSSLRPGEIVDIHAGAKHSLRALARRWLGLTTEIEGHRRELERLTRAVAPRMIAALGIGSDTAAEMLIAVGDNPDRLNSEAAFASLCGVCPIPASSGKTNRHRLNRGGNRAANSALFRVVVVRMRWHQPTIEYVERRSAEGKTKREIIRCLKRYVAREIYGYLTDSGATPRVAAA